MTRNLTFPMLLLLFPAICKGQLVEPEAIVETTNQSSIELDFATVKMLSETDSGWLEFSSTDSITGAVTYGMLWADDEASDSKAFGPPNIPPNPQTPPGTVLLGI